jgi:hypothetical protein
MPTWEETKRAGQTAFIIQGDGLQGVPDSISELYRQIVSQGIIGENLTRQIAEGILEPSEPQQPGISRSVEQDIEPER